MGYYDFNDHFWAPNEACKQKSAIIEPKEQLSLAKKLNYWLRSLRHEKVDIPEESKKLDRTKS